MARMLCTGCSLSRSTNNRIMQRLWESKELSAVC